MKKRSLVTIAGRFEADALRVLREIPGLTVEVVRGPSDSGVDAILHFADTHSRISVQFKERCSSATAWQLVHDASAAPGTPLVLIAGETTAEARRILVDHAIAVIDGLGNAHIELPGLLLHVEGSRRRPRAATTPAPARLQGKAGVAAQALLLHPDRPWQVQDLAKEAGVSTGLAHRVLARLENEEIVLAEGSGPGRLRRVARPGALLDLWAEENVDRPKRTLAFLLAQTPQQLISKVTTNLGGAGIDYALTGPAGASLIAPFVTTIPVVDVWVTAIAAPEELCDAAQGDPVADGQNIVFLQAKKDTPLAFRQQTKRVWIANKFRLYGDLWRDPRRGREQAEHLRQEVIGF